MFKKTLCMTGLLFLIGVAGFFVFRNIVIIHANLYSKELRLSMLAREHGPPPTDKDLSLHYTKSLYEQFSKNGYERHKILARLRPYLSNKMLPSFIQFPPGTLEILTMEGWCDDAARALIYILSYHGIKGEQWNMQGPNSAHAAVVATFSDGTTGLRDPFYGYYSYIFSNFFSKNKNISTDTLAIRKSLQKNPSSYSDNLHALDKEKSNHAFYKDFGKMFMGVQGEPLTITAQIPAIDKPLTLGTLDGNSRDVYGQLMQNDMTMTWEYAGHKYDRGWTREMLANAPVQVQLILTREPNDGLLRTFTPAPAVDGTKLTWNLLKDEKITSEDAKAAISWTRLKSYIDVDQIVITPEGATP